ncbi:MAG TPA: lysylphosphatidylglycerol synthase domain-containing protein [Actinophytocola sp.]|uniref:lysylphosphatidylglycerol synthase domain-containing protein n=1 Tax=Actinophytocola sp. TaxID=1872138 RepID=UPI002DB6A8A0|nr:lysylphosphatidylglycerol synthase domain-containing protein [Actinophytocola sp.]HEU5473261.1 lysylphosphatidylglycerol synthase domain-containing protein [Actinophytocola sp.]
MTAVTQWLRRVLVTGVLAGAVHQLIVRWPEVSGTLLALPLPSVLVSFLLVLAAVLLGPFMWQTVLRDLGTASRTRDASMIFLVGQLGKYVPGSVWSFLVQMELAKAAGITRVRALTASVVATGIGIVASLLSGFLALPVLLVEHREYLWLFVLLPAGLVLLHPRPLTWLVSRGLRLLRRPPLPHPLTPGAIARTLGLGLATFVLLGLHLWLLADALGSPGMRGLMLCTGAMALAMTAGLLAFFLPSGIGAREVVLVAALASVLPAGTAIALAVVSRVMFTVADLASAGVATLLARPRRRDDAAHPVAAT